MPRKPASKIDIDVVPYLSIMVIVLKLICLILVVTVMKIALNPDSAKAVAIQDLFGQERKGAIKAPTYFDCTPEGVVIIPGNIQVIPSDLSLPGNAVEAAIKKIRQNTSNQYAIALVRPRGIRVYRHVRKLLTEAEVDVGFDVFDTHVKIDYAKAAKAAGIFDEEPANAKDP
jgi:hypothetical protein